MSTDLCFIMHYYGSDKGDPSLSRNHNYTRTYDELFRGMRQDKLRVFELGLGTNNTNFPSNMGPDGRPGASLRGWKQYFKNASIFGADIDKGVLFEEERIKTYFCDQNNGDAIREMWSHPELGDGFDIIIEDGLHIYESNVNFFENSYHKLYVGGFFIIEDIMHYTLDRWTVKLDEWRLKYPGFSFRMRVLPHPTNIYDNTLLVCQRIY
jgi:SAM-dependent methyltransferase